MTPGSALRILVPLLLLGVLGSQGCTVIGYGLGSLRDHSSASYLPKDSLSYVDLEAVDPTGEATVIAADGILHQGTLRGFIETPDSLFVLQVARWCGKNPTSPYSALMGGVLQVKTRYPEGIYSGTLAGLSMDAVHLRENTPIGRVHTLPMDRIRCLTDATGKAFAPDSLVVAIEQREIPVSKSLRFYDSSGHRTLIPWHEVRSVAGKAREVQVTGRIVGTVLGLGADIAIVAIAVKDALRHMFDDARWNMR